MIFSQTEQSVNFHISLHVADIPRSVDFFQKLFGVPAAKQRSDYAKFELQNPPLTLSLEPVSPAERGALNHVGFRLNSAEELVELQRRLEMAGISSEREEGVECCYAKQSKFWLHDPDQNLWEIYILEGDLEHRGAGQAAAKVQGTQNDKATVSPIACSTGSEIPARQQWAHRLGNEFSIPEEIAAESLDEIALQGSFNVAGADAAISGFLKQTAERLKPGGELTVHCLTSDIPVTEALQLSGPASVVKYVPCLDELLRQLESAGFENIMLTKYGTHACFTVGEAELRETMLRAMKPVSLVESLVTVVYKGPFPEIVLDSGLSLERGRFTTIPAALYQQLLETAVGKSLVLIESATRPVSCTS